MLIEDFKAKYSGIPFTTFSRNHKKGAVLLDSGALLHMHKEMEIIHVLDGEALFYIDADEFKITKGDIVIVCPFMLHRSKILSECDFQHHCICFDLDIIYDQKLKKDLLDGKASVVRIIKNDPCLSEFIESAFLSHKYKNVGWELEIAGNMSLFMGKLKQGGHVKTQSAAHPKNIYRKIIEYIAENYQNDITSSDASKSLHINNSYFCRLFKKNFGCTFQNYLCMYRIQISKSLLRDVDLSISQIASKTGFNSISYYSKKFKELVSLTPAEYRKAHKK